MSSRISQQKRTNTSNTKNSNKTLRLQQQFPTGGARTPGVRNKIFRGSKCEFRGWEFVSSWMYFFSKEPRFMKAFQCYYSKEHPA